MADEPRKKDKYTISMADTFHAFKQTGHKQIDIKLTFSNEAPQHLRNTTDWVIDEKFNKHCLNSKKARQLSN